MASQKEKPKSNQSKSFKGLLRTSVVTGKTGTHKIER